MIGSMIFKKKVEKKSGMQIVEAGFESFFFDGQKRFVENMRNMEMSKA